MTEHRTRRLAGLDGLRAVAALGVLLYHAADWSGRPGRFAHGYLAVDFFFCLSGFVLAHAFERREIGWPAYLWIRVVRIWPLLVLSTLIGAVLTSRHSPPFWPNLARGLLLVPRLGHPAEWTFPTLFPFNPPAWSLCLEVIVSALWFPLRRAPDLVVAAIVFCCGVVMAWAALGLNGVETGWDQATFWLGVVRAAFSFGLGWLGWRYRALAPRPRLGLAAVVLLTVLVMPLMPGRPWNGLYDFACVAVLFPLLVLIGANDPQGVAGALCRATGDLSYPLYATHWATWAVMLRLYPDGWKSLLPVWLPALAVVLAPIVAWVAFRLYDAPVRRWLRAWNPATQAISTG
ncbi:acyltransferase family protein [Caulobacter rhizosphaerae]|uniref:acyltransferase family protein n=1 Tax=Caulobacter rhizosphaerae TaxID=2010972 RepID=UPI0013D5C261|nr:acyltransferase [Caulobacter rhizosphaerae]GGL25750.1 acetyltransferase [Caulobacter rhizosphaerae]